MSKKKAALSKEEPSTFDGCAYCYRRLTAAELAEEWCIDCQKATTARTLREGQAA